MQYLAFAKRTILSNDKQSQLFVIFSSKHLALSIYFNSFKTLYYELNTLILLFLLLLFKSRWSNQNLQSSTLVRNSSTILYLFVSISLIYSKRVNTSISSCANTLKSSNWTSRHLNFSNLQILNSTSRESSTSREETTTTSRASSFSKKDKRNFFRKETSKSFCLQTLLC